MADFSVKLTITGDGTVAVKAVQQVGAETDKMAGKARAAGATTGKAFEVTAKGAANLGAEIGRASSAMAELAAMAGGLQAVKSLFGGMIAAADAAGQLESRLKLATTSQAEYAAVMERVQDVARASYVSINDIAEVYIRSIEPMRQLGAGTRETLDLTEALSLALVVSAADTQKRASAIDALSKVMQTGNVQLQEFTTLTTAAPRFVSALEAALGKSRAELIGMVSAGQLTSAEIAKVGSQLELLREEVESMPTTVEDAMTAFRDAVQMWAGAANEGVTSTHTLVSAIDFLSRNIDGVMTVALIGAVAVLAQISTAGAGWIASLYAQQQAAAQAAATALADARAKVTETQATLGAARAAVADASAKRAQALATGLTASASTAYVAAKEAEAAATLQAAAAQKEMDAITAASTSKLALLTKGIWLATAAYAGWQVGAWIREQFEGVRVAADYFAGSTIEVWNRIKQGAQIAWEAIKAVAIGAINTIREKLADAYGMYADFAGKLPGAGALAERMREIETSLRPTSSAADDFKAALERINTTAAAQSKSIWAVIGDMVAYERQATSAKAATEEYARTGQVTSATLTAAFADMAKSVEGQMDKLKEQNALIGKGSEGQYEYAKSLYVAKAATIADTAARAQYLARVNETFDPLINQAKANDALKASMDRSRRSATDATAEYERLKKAQESALERLFAPRAGAGASDEEKALLDYAAALREIAKAGADAIVTNEALGKAGVSQSVIQKRINALVEDATANWKAETKAIQERAKAKAEQPYIELKKALDDYLRRGRELIDTQRAELEAGGQLNEMQQAELDIRHMLAEATDATRAKLEEETEAIRKNAAERQRLRAAGDLVKGGLSGFDSIARALRSGTDGWAEFGQAGADALNGIARPLTDLIAATREANDGAMDWSAFMSSVGDAAKQHLPEIAKVAGAIAVATMGDKDGAVVSAMLSMGVAGASIGGAIAAGASGGSAGGPWGMAIGAIIGAIVGGVMASMAPGDPAIYGSSRAGSVSRDGQAGTQTPLGVIGIDTDNLGDDAFRGFADAVKGFDQQLARVLDPSQLSAAQAALQGWSGKFSDINGLLASRLDAVLASLGSTFEGFVNGFAGDIQGKLQALADAVSIQKLFKAGNGITGISFEKALEFVTTYAQAGERVAETYQRIAAAADAFDAALRMSNTTLDLGREEVVAFAADINEFIGSADRAKEVWGRFFEAFYTESERTGDRAIAERMRATDSLTGIGLDVNTTREQFRAAFEAALPTLTPEQVARWLEAGNAIANATDAAQAYADAVMASQANYAQFIADLNKDGAGLSSVSPFVAQRMQIEKWAQDSIAQANRLARAAGLQGAAEQDLTLIHNIAAQRVALAIQALMDSTRELVDVFYGRGADADAAATAVRDFGSAITESANAAVEAANLLLGALSPLNDQRKLEYAIGAYQRGEVDRDDVLQIGRRLYASSQAYTDLFNRMMAMPGGRQTGGSDTWGADAASAVASTTRSADEIARERHAAAQQIAQNIASLSNATDASFQSVADELRVSLADLAGELGLSQDDFTAYLERLVAQENAVPDSIQDGTERIIAALYDIASGGTGPDAVFEDRSRLYDVPEAKALQIAGPTPEGAQNTEALNRVGDMLGELLVAVRTGNGEIAQAVDGVADATRDVRRSVDNGNDAAQAGLGRNLRVIV